MIQPRVLLIELTIDIENEYLNQVENKMAGFEMLMFELNKSILLNEKDMLMMIVDKE